MALLGWWYGAGWGSQLDRMRLKLGRIGDYFSSALLFRTRFQPFREIDAGGVRGGLDIQVRAWGNRLISRAIGAMIRLVMIFVGSLWWLVVALGGCCWLLIWPLLPLFPLIGILLAQVVAV